MTQGSAMSLLQALRPAGQIAQGQKVCGRPARAIDTVFEKDLTYYIETMWAGSRQSLLTVTYYACVLVVCNIQFCLLRPPVTLVWRVSKGGEKIEIPRTILMDSEIKDANVCVVWTICIQIIQT